MGFRSDNPVIIWEEKEYFLSRIFLIDKRPITAVDGLNADECGIGLLG